MQNTRESIQYHHPELCLRVWEAERPSSFKEWHYHREVEFLFIQEGVLDVHLLEGSHAMGAGDIMVIGANQPHSTFKVSSASVRYIVLQLDSSAYLDAFNARYAAVMKEIMAPLNRANYMFTEQPEVRGEAERAVRGILTEMRGLASGYEMAVSSLVKHLFFLLIRHDNRQALGQWEMYRHGFLNQALEYVDRHYQSRLTVKEVSREVHLSPSHFMRQFKQAMGLTFSAYLQQKRLRRAEQLLLTEDWSIEEVAHQVGMPNRAHFYDTFRRLHRISPGEFRSRHRPSFVQETR